MKSTDYYKSGRMKTNGLIGLQKGKGTLDNTKNQRIELYNQHPSLCNECQKPLSYKQRKYKHCSHVCGAKGSNRTRAKNGFSMPESAKQALSISTKQIQIERRNSKILQYNQNPKKCQICHNPLPYEKRTHKSCSDTCKKALLRIGGQKGGLKSASSPRAKRSKNEILFYELCQKTFNIVTHNDPIFEGWDADVLIHDHKIAVLWNGDWHYREMGCYNHNLGQVQRRDAYKDKLIAKYGWHLFIIKDTTQSPTSPSIALVELQKWILDNL